MPIVTITTPVNGWRTGGNAGTNPATNYIGTSDNQDVVIKRNNVTQLMVGAASITSTVGLDMGNNTISNVTDITYANFAQPVFAVSGTNPSASVDASVTTVQAIVGQTVTLPAGSLVIGARDLISLSLVWEIYNNDVVSRNVNFGVRITDGASPPTDVLITTSAQIAIGNTQYYSANFQPMPFDPFTLMFLASNIAMDVPSSLPGNQSLFQGFNASGGALSFTPLIQFLDVVAGSAATCPQITLTRIRP